MKLSFISDNLTEQDMDFAQRAGFHGLEANVHVGFGHAGGDKSLCVLEKKAAWVRDRMDAHGLAMAGLGIWELNLIDPSVQEEHLHFYSRMLAVAKTLGCKVLYHGTGSIKGMSLTEQINRYVCVAPQLVDESEKCGVRPCIYSANMFNFGWDPVTWDVLFSQLHGLGLKYDPSHLFHERKPYIEPLARLLAKFGKIVCHVHIKDVLLLGEDPPLEPPAGMGQLDWGILIGLLQLYGYSGFLSLEPHGPWNKNEQMRQWNLVLSKRHIEQYMI